MMEKEIEYAAKLTQVVAEAFDPENANYIDPKEFNEEDNATAFIHALATLMPCQIYKKLLNQPCEDHLEFNHIVNRLVFQFANKAE